MLLTVTSFSVSCCCSRSILAAKPFRQRADRLVLRILEQLPLAGDDTVDGVEQFGRPRLIEAETIDHPRPQLGRALRRSV